MQQRIFDEALYFINSLASPYPERGLILDFPEDLESRHQQPSCARETTCTWDVTVKGAPLPSPVWELIADDARSSSVSTDADFVGSAAFFLPARCSMGRGKT